jgi:hypothetical protein
MDFLNPKNHNYFKSSFKHLKMIILKKYFVILFTFLIASWYEIENGRNLLVSISSKYSYFKPVFNYTRKTLKRDSNPSKLWHPSVLSISSVWL